MRQVRAKGLIFGSAGKIAGTVYGTIVVMATITAGSFGEHTDAWRLAAAVAVTVLVLWIAHVYSHALAESIERSRRLTGQSSVKLLGASSRFRWPLRRPSERLYWEHSALSARRQPSGSRWRSGWRR